MVISIHHHWASWFGVREYDHLHSRSGYYYDQVAMSKTQYGPKLRSRSFSVVKTKQFQFRTKSYASCGTPY